MKKILSLFAIAVMTFCLSVTAQANVFDVGGDFVIKFRGFEYAYTGTSDDFMSGSENAGVLKGDVLANPDGTLNVGFNMTSVLWTTGVYTTSGPGVEPADPYPVYTGDRKENGLYLSVLHDLHAESTKGSLGDGNAMLYFTGGVLDWYYIPYVDENSLTIADLNSATWVEGRGLVLGNGLTLDSYLTELTPFVSFELAGENGHTGIANVYINEGGVVEANASFHANTTDPDSPFTSDAYNGFDLSFQADLKWLGERFSVDDPAYVSRRAPTPEPASLLLMSMGLLVTGYVARRNRKAA